MKILFFFNCLFFSLPVLASGTVSITKDYFFNNQHYYTDYDLKLAVCASYDGLSNCNPPNSFIDLYSLTDITGLVQVRRLVIIIANVPYTLICPENSTGTTTCTCTDPYVPNGDASACVMPACPDSGTVQNTGFYDLGTVETAIPKLTTCNSSGCQAEYSGSGIVARALVFGVYHYYSKGSYTYTGESCLAGSPNTAISSLTSTPGATCAEGQSFIHMNGVDKCLDSGTGAESSPYSESSVAAAQTLQDAAIQKAIDDAERTAIEAGLSGSAVEAAKTFAAGAAAASFNSDMPSDNGFAPDDPLNAFCRENPLADICKINQVQAKEAGALPDIGSGSWYTKTYPNGVQGVLTDNFNTMKNTPLYGLLGNITPTISGAAFNGCFSLDVLNYGTQTLCIPEGVITFIGICILLTALFAARAIIFGG